MSKFLERPILGRIEVIGGKFVFNGGFIVVELSYTENITTLEMLSTLESEDGDMLSLTIIDKKDCILNRFPAIKIADIMILKYDTVLYTNVFSKDSEYLEDNFKINGVRCTIPGNLYVTDGDGYYQIKRLDNDNESLTYTKFVDMKLKDLDNLDSVALLLHLQEVYNKNFMFYLEN